MSGSVTNDPIDSPSFVASIRASSNTSRVVRSEVSAVTPTRAPSPAGAGAARLPKYAASSFVAMSRTSESSPMLTALRFADMIVSLEIAVSPASFRGTTVIVLNAGSSVAISAPSAYQPASASSVITGTSMRAESVRRVVETRAAMDAWSNGRTSSDWKRARRPVAPLVVVKTDMVRNPLGSGSPAGVNR